MNHIVRSDLPDELFKSLKHLAVDLRRPMGQLLAEAVVLLLRHHGRGDGLPPPEDLQGTRGGAQ